MSFALWNCPCHHLCAPRRNLSHLFHAPERRIIKTPLTRRLYDPADSKNIPRNILVQKIICFYGDSIEGLTSYFLERGLTTFGDQLKILTKEMSRTEFANPVNSIAEMAH